MLLPRASPQLLLRRLCRSAGSDGFPSVQDLQLLVKRLVNSGKGLTSSSVFPSKRTRELCERSEKLLQEMREIGTHMRSCSTEEDHQMFSLLQEEQEQHRCRLEEIRWREDEDERNVVLEVVSGRTTGGDICQQFSQELLEMYHRFSTYKHWRWEQLNYSPAEYGGLHHATVRISGETAFSSLQFEAGTHRIQCIPETGLSSRMQRVHTGTASVIVLLETPTVTVDISAKDLRIDTFRASGAGGQHVNTTDSAVRVTHLPTGTVCECQQFRSQLKNRETALRELKARLEQSMMGKHRENSLLTRRTQVGSRAQAERIRTYNFTQDRVTDHRIGFETRDIKEFMKGGEALENVLQLLREKHQRERLMELLKKNS